QSDVYSFRCLRRILASGRKGDDAGPSWIISREATPAKVLVGPQAPATPLDQHPIHLALADWLAANPLQTSVPCGLVVGSLAFRAATKPELRGDSFAGNTKRER